MASRPVQIELSRQLGSRTQVPDCEDPKRPNPRVSPVTSATWPLSVPSPTDSAALLRDPPGFIGRAPADDKRLQPLQR